MKKYLFLILGLICLSCEQPMTEKSVKIVNGNAYLSLKATHFNYENHQYVYFQKSNGKYATGGIVHDPNCNCHGGN